MKGLVKLSILAILTVGASVANAVQLDIHNRDSVRLDRAPWWNLSVVEASNTTYKLTSKSGVALSGVNYGRMGIGLNGYDVSGNLTLTQGACNTLWGTTTNRDVHIYAGYSAGPALCVSDVAGQTAVGAVTVGSAGYISCTKTLAEGTAIRQVASADLNCTGPVIGTVKEINAQTGEPLVIKKRGTASSATAAAALVFAIKGLEAADDCVVTPVSWGTGPNYVKFAAVTADTLTVTVDTAQSGGSSVVNYVCW